VIVRTARSGDVSCLNHRHDIVSFDRAACRLAWARMRVGQIRHASSLTGDDMQSPDLSRARPEQRWLTGENRGWGFGRRGQLTTRIARAQIYHSHDACSSGPPRSICYQGSDIARDPGTYTWPDARRVCIRHQRFVPAHPNPLMHVMLAQVLPGCQCSYSVVTKQCAMPCRSRHRQHAS
jgi:hypothetical protein